MKPKNRRLIIINPNAGKVIDKTYREFMDISQHLNADIISFDLPDDPLKFNSSLNEMISFHAERYNTFLVFGGDGSHSKIANSIATTGLGEEISLGFFPMGSGNALARQFNGDITLETAVNLFENQDENAILTDVMSVNNEAYCFNAGIGLDAHIVEMASKSDLWNFPAHFVETAKAVRYKPEKRRILNIEGKPISSDKSYLIVVGKTKLWGYGVRANPDAVVDDGNLHMMVYSPNGNSYTPFADLMADLFRRTFSSGKLGDYQCSPEFTVKNNPAAAVHLDGEPFGRHEDLTFKVVPKALKVIRYPEVSSTF